MKQTTARTVCRLFGHQYDGYKCKRCHEITDHPDVLFNVVRNGSYFEACECAFKMLLMKDYRFGPIVMERKMLYGDMAVVMSRIPGEEYFMPLILAICKDALLDRNVPLGEMRFHIKDVSDVFRNLIDNTPDKAIAYIRVISENLFFVEAGGELFAARGQTSSFIPGRERCLDHQAEKVVSCAKKALEKVPPERISAAAEKENIRYELFNERVNGALRSVLYAETRY